MLCVSRAHGRSFPSRAPLPDLRNRDSLVDDELLKGRSADPDGDIAALGAEFAVAIFADNHGLRAVAQGVVEGFTRELLAHPHPFDVARAVGEEHRDAGIRVL